MKPSLRAGAVPAEISPALDHLASDDPARIPVERIHCAVFLAGSDQLWWNRGEDPGGAHAMLVGDAELAFHADRQICGSDDIRRGFDPDLHVFARRGEVVR